MRIQPDDRFPAGRLASLPAASFDVVVFSLVLSYLPLPTLRGAMVAQSRRLLPTPDPAAAAGAVAAAEAMSRGEAAASSTARGSASPHRQGLLLLTETLGVDHKARCWAEQHTLHAWIAAVESLGFSFLRHETLERSHALAFATRYMNPAELAALAVLESAPPMRMRSEERSRCQPAAKPPASGR